MKGPEELKAESYGNPNEISKNHPASYEGDSCSSFHRESNSYSSFENYSCLNLRNSHTSPTPFHLRESKANKLEVTLQQIQEQLQLNLLKQALIIKQQKFNKTYSHNQKLIDQWKSIDFEHADDELHEFFCKESQSRIIEGDCNICDEGRGALSNSENDYNFFKAIDSVHHSNFSNTKTVVKKVNATDEEKNLSNDLLKFTSTSPLNVDELDLYTYSSMCCENLAERNSYLRCRRSLIHSHGLKNIPVLNESVKKSNSANYMTSDDKFSAMQLQQQLGIQQQELIQQLQLVQRQYLMHQEVLTQEAQHSPALVFPSYVRTPLQPFEYRSKNNYELSSTGLLKNSGNFVSSQDFPKQDQSDQQSENIEVTRNDFCNNFESQEATAEACIAHSPQQRRKYKNQSPFSPSSKGSLNRDDVDETNAERHLMHLEYSKAESMKEQSKKNLTRDIYSNEQSEDECHSQNPDCSPVACLTKANPPTTEGGNHNYQSMNEKCEKVSKNELEISPRSCINDSLNDTMSIDQQSSIGASFAEFVNTDKQYQHLFAHGMCRWPGCELILDDGSAFVKCFHPGEGLVKNFNQS